MKIDLNIDIEQLRQDITSDVVAALRPLLTQGRGEKDHLYTIKELSKHLDVKTGWLYKAVHHHEIPFVKVGRHLRFKKNEIDQWLQENSTPQVNPLSTNKLKAVK